MGNARPKETEHKSLLSSDKREKFKERRKPTAIVKKDKEDKALKTEKRAKQSDKEGKLICAEKGKTSEKSLPKNEKEDKENISENDREYSGDAQVDKKPENDIVKSPQENLREPKRKRGRPPSIAPTGEFPRCALRGCSFCGSLVLHNFVIQPFVFVTDLESFCHLKTSHVCGAEFYGRHISRGT